MFCSAQFMKKPLTRHLQTHLPVFNFLITQVFFPHSYIYLHSCQCKYMGTVVKRSTNKNGSKCPDSHHSFRILTFLSQLYRSQHHHTQTTYIHIPKLPSDSGLVDASPSLNSRLLEPFREQQGFCHKTAPHLAITCIDCIHATWRRNSLAL